MTNQIKNYFWWIIAYRLLNINITVLATIASFKRSQFATVCSHRKTEYTTFNNPIDGKSAWTAERENTNKTLYSNFNEK